MVEDLVQVSKFFDHFYLHVDGNESIVRKPNVNRLKIEKFFLSIGFDELR